MMYTHTQFGPWHAAFCAALASIVLAVPAQARFIRPDVVNVPVERLVANLQQRIDKDPKDLRAHFNLARLHAMAYALKIETAEAWRGKEEQGAWFGHVPKPIPFDVKQTDDPAKRNAARKHLDESLKHYDVVIKADADNLLALLGHAWAVEQQGDRDKAVDEYRKLIDKAWGREKEMERGPLGWHPITAETAGYLIPLLDADKDSTEIATLKERSKHVLGIPRPVTPLIIPLRDGLSVRDLVDPNARVQFDADGTALAQTWTWITPNAGWLVHDPLRTGRVTSALQLFGTATFCCSWQTGYHALSALDDDADGLLTGQELNGLAIWRDADGNGVSDPGEVRPLSECGVLGLSCRHEMGGSPDCAAWSSAGVVFHDGTRRPTYDILLLRR